MLTKGEELLAYQQSCYTSDAHPHYRLRLRQCRGLCNMLRDMVVRTAPSTRILNSSNGCFIQSMEHPPTSLRVAGSRGDAQAWRLVQDLQFLLNCELYIYLVFPCLYSFSCFICLSNTHLVAWKIFYHTRK